MSRGNIFNPKSLWLCHFVNPPSPSLDVTTQCLWPCFTFQPVWPQKLKVPSSLNRVHRKGSERQARCYPTVGEGRWAVSTSLLPGRTRSHRWFGKAESSRQQTHRKPFVWKLGHALTENILQHSPSPNRNSHIPWNGLFIIQQLVKNKVFFFPPDLKHKIFSSIQDFTKFTWRNSTKGRVCRCRPRAGPRRLLGARQPWCKLVFMGPWCLGGRAKAMSFY